MLTLLLTRWFSRQSGREAYRDRRKGVTFPRPSTPAPRPRAGVPALRVTVSQSADWMVIRVTGDARADCVGALLDGLPTTVGRAPAMVTLDLSELRSISCVALCVLRTYCYRVVRTGGRVRLAKKLPPIVKDTLRAFGTN